MQPNKLFISDELMQILEKMKPASVIANQLIDLSQDITSHPILSDHPNYLGQSAEVQTNISYLTVERIAALRETLSDFEQDVWTSKKRFRARPAALVQKILRDCNGRDVEIFSNVFKSVTSLVNFKFSIVKGEDIRYWYHYSRNADSSGSLGASCMKHDFCQEYFDIYCKNTDQISLLLMLDSRERVLGRALIWEDESVKIMDRIYTINDEELTYHFKMWANENGYLYKAYQRWNMPLQIIKDNKEQVYRIKIKLKHWDFPKFPYVDTFKFLDTRSGMISNYDTEDSDIILMHSEGKFMPKEYLFEDFVDNCFYHNSEAVTIEYLPDGPKQTRGENCRWSEVLQRYILRSDAQYNDDIDDYVFGDKFKEMNNDVSIYDLLRNRVVTDFDSFARFLIRKKKFDKILADLGKVEDVVALWKKDKDWVLSTVEELINELKTTTNEQDNSTTTSTETESSPTVWSSHPLEVGIQNRNNRLYNLPEDYDLSLSLRHLVSLSSRQYAERVSGQIFQ